MKHIRFDVPDGLTKEKEDEWKRETVERLIQETRLNKKKPRKKKDLTVIPRTVLELNENDWNRFKEQASKSKLTRAEYLKKVVKQELEVCYERNRDQKD